MTSPIVLQKSTLNKNFDPLVSATTGNSSKVWDYHNETEAVGEYMTDYYLLKPQRNFHRPITVILPVKHELKSNYTYHVFVVSQGELQFLRSFPPADSRILASRARAVHRARGALFRRRLGIH
jgi:hypothetical protein